MKHSITVCVSVIALALLTDVLAAQQPGGWGRRQMGRPGQPGGDRPMHGQGFRPPPPPLMTALDADKDGELSAKEIKAAAAALKKLDKNKDGKLSREELRPSWPGGPNRQGGFGQGRGPRRHGGPRQPGGGQGGNLVERLMSFDRNRDGKVDKRELPPAMQPVLGRADTNNDGAIDKAEARKMFQQAQQGGRGDGFGRGDRQGRGRGRNAPDRGGRQGGERQQKPRPADKGKDEGKKDKDDDEEISFF